MSRAVHVVHDFWCGGADPACEEQCGRCKVESGDGKHLQGPTVTLTSTRELKELRERQCKCGEPGGKMALCVPCQRKSYGDFNHGGGKGDPEYLKLLDEIGALHLVKSGGYGTGSDPFANFTAVAETSGEPRYYYAILRAMEKLTRCLSLHGQGRAGELGEEFTDIASLALCAEAMRRSDTA